MKNRDWLLLGASVVLLVGNLADGILTLVLLELRVAAEVNPLLRWLYEASPLGFMVAKLALIQLSALLLQRHGHVPAARYVLAGGAVIYLTLAIYDATCLAGMVVADWGWLGGTAG